MNETPVLLELKNDQLAFRLYRDASGELEELKTAVRWRMRRAAVQEYGPIVPDNEAVFFETARPYAKGYPGHFRGKRLNEDTVRFVLLGRLGKEQGSFTCRVRLDGPWLEFSIEQIDENLPSLVFPPALEADSVVLPAGVGKWIRKHSQVRMFYSAFGRLSMRWFGGLRGETGWIGIFTAGHADAGVHVVGLTASPAWLKSLGKWADRRVVRYRTTTGGYVGQAKAFRDWAKANGLHKTLRQKIKETPALERLLGGRFLAMNQARTSHLDRFETYGLPISDRIRRGFGKLDVSFTHAQAARAISQAREDGMDRGLVKIKGWIKGGYDESHPDIWPPDEALGTVDEMRQLLAAGPLVGALHDNYQDIYEHCPSFPKGVMRLSNGELTFGGVWSGGQAYLLCSKAGLEYARRNWQQIRTLRPEGMFIDTTTASPLYECYDPDHPMSRAEDERYKLELLKFYKSEGMILGSEEGRDFAAAVVDFYENRHRHVPGESIPLWPLVYHDAVLCGRYFPPTAPERFGQGAPNMLTDLLWGYMLYWQTGSPEAWQRMRADFRACGFVDAWHGRIGLDEMTGHAFLREDDLVERTEFSSGLSIVANYSAEPATVGGATVAPGGHLILQ